MSTRRRRRRSARRHTPRPLTRRTIILTTLTILVILGARLVTSFAGDDSTAAVPSDSAPYTPVSGATLVNVERIIDGDTFVVEVGGEPTTVRLYGVDTPERGEMCHEEATARLRTLAADRVQLVPDARLEDRFGRWLRYAYTADAASIDEVLVAEGLGNAWREDGDLRERIIAAERTAQTEGSGCIWSRYGTRPEPTATVPG